MADDEGLNLFATMLAIGNQADLLTAQGLRDMGVPVDPDWHEDFLLLAFFGDLIGFNVEGPEGASTGMSRVLLTSQNAATVAAILTVYGTGIVGKTRFTAMLDQELARVGQKYKEEREQAA